MGLALASTAKEVVKLALDKDLKDIGASCIPEEINRGKVDSIQGPMVLMVTKVRNIAAPKAKEESQAGPRMLKVSLSDGSMTCHAVEVSPCPKISLKTAPGTKVRLSKGPLEVSGGFIKLNEGALEVLGGRVEALVEKWLTAQSLAEFTRADLRIGTGGEVGYHFVSLFNKKHLIISGSSKMGRIWSKEADA